MTKLLEILGKSRWLAVPMLALGVIAAVGVTGAVETRAERGGYRPPGPCSRNWDS